MDYNEDYKILKRIKNSDERGWLTELLRTDEIGEFKHVYCATIEPGKERGGHYHKKRREWFCVVEGQGQMILVDDKGGETILDLDSDDLRLVEISPFIYHVIKNVGENKLIFVSGTSDLYNKEDPDTYRKLP